MACRPISFSITLLLACSAIVAQSVAQERPPDSTPRPTPAPAPAYKWSLRIKQCSWSGGACPARSSERIGERCNCLVRSPTSAVDHDGRIVWSFISRRAN